MKTSRYEGTGDYKLGAARPEIVLPILRAIVAAMGLKEGSAHASEETAGVFSFEQTRGTYGAARGRACYVKETGWITWA